MNDENDFLRTVEEFCQADRSEVASVNLDEQWRSHRTFASAPQTKRIPVGQTSGIEGRAMTVQERRYLAYHAKYTACPGKRPNRDVPKVTTGRYLSP